MKVKLKGAILKHPMDYNEIAISPQAIGIHNTNNTGYGFMSKYKAPDGVEETIKMILNKKDYMLLASMEEFNLEKKSDVINITTTGFKAKFTDMKEVHLPYPDISGLQGIGIKYTDIYAGKSFMGNKDRTKVMLDGATIRHDKIIITNGKRCYQKAIKNDALEINVPLEVYKHLDPNEDYDVLSNGKFAVFKTRGHAYYTNLIETLVNIPTVKDEGKVEFKVDRDTLSEKLKLMKNYTDVVNIIAEDTSLEMIAINEGNEIDLKLPIVPVKLKKVVINWSIADMMALLGIVESGEVRIKVTDKMIIIGNKNEDIVAFAGIITCQRMEVTA